MTASLEQLYRTTLDLFSGPSQDMAALEWTDRVLPRFTEACRHSVSNVSPNIFSSWREWLSGDGIQLIRFAGDPDLFVWRSAWLMMLVETAQALSEASQLAGDSAKNRCQLAKTLHAIAPPPLSCFVPAFWQNLVDWMGSEPSSPEVPSQTVGVFPLVLMDRMIVDGDVIDCVMAEFHLEATPYPGGTVYLHPEQVAIRGLDNFFLQAFEHAAREAAALAPSGTLPCVRVRIMPRTPGHAVFLQNLMLRGPSGGGALAVALHALWSGNSISRKLAVSFALNDTGQSMSDGRCHTVGGASEKVRGCAACEIQTLVVSAEQSSQVSFYGHIQNVGIAGAESVADAIAAVNAAVKHSPANAAQPNVLDDDGVLPLGSTLYLERRSDSAFHTALSLRPMIVLVKGARQIGKTSLLVRGVEQIRRRDARMVYVDLQSFERQKLRTQREFFSTLSRIFARELGLGITMDDIYDERDGPNKNFENFLFRHALESPVMWFMDEVDRLFDFDFYTDVFSLMRSWHNRRPIHPELGNLTLILSYATETHLLIEDVYQSPFNVGVKVEIEDFTPEQIEVLNERVGRPLRTAQDVQKFVSLVGGHPHLACRGLSWIANERRTIEDFGRQASSDGGLFGTHLRGLLKLSQNAEQVNVIRELLNGQPCRNNDVFLHLRSAGVVLGDDSSNMRMRCEIYATFLRRHLLCEEARSIQPVVAPSFWQRFRRKVRQ